MATLLDDLGQLATPGLLSNVASTLGESEQNVGRGLSGGFSSLLAGLVNKTGDSNAMQQFFSLATDPANDDQVLDNPAGLVDSIAGGARSPIVSLGERFTSSVFGGRTSAATDVLSRFSGLRAGAISSILRLAAPLVLGMLGRRIRQGSLNAGGLGALLNSEKDGILRAAPPGLTEALRAAPEREVPLRGDRYDTPRATTPRPGEPPVREEHHGKRRIWPVLAALAAFGLIWASWPRGERRITEIDITTPAGPTTVVGGEVAPPAGQRLPSGEILDVREGGMEATVLAFIRNPAYQVNDTTWFEFDKLLFETGSSNLRPESNQQLKDIAVILKAYPNVSAKIGGYTDSVGVAADNKRLSEQRAQSVRKALVANGIAASRLEAEGYGEEHPVADNATETGRTRNRRIALLVTKK